jgi:hypothetical protein
VGKSTVLKTARAGYPLPAGNTPALITERLGGVFHLRSEVDCDENTIQFPPNQDGSPRLVDGQPTFIPKAGDWFVLRYTATGYTTEERGNVNGTAAFDTLDPYISATGPIGSAVTAGTFTNGELQGTQPAGSQAGMKFTTTSYGYEYQRGASGPLVWCRYAKN